MTSFRKFFVFAATSAALGLAPFALTPATAHGTHYSGHGGDSRGGYGSYGHEGYRYGGYGPFGYYGDSYYGYDASETAPSEPTECAYVSRSGRRCAPERP
jgi:hypothetical protein